MQTIKELVQLRKDFGISQQQIAVLMNRALNTVNRLENAPLERSTIGLIKEYLAALEYTLSMEVTKNVSKRTRRRTGRKG
jgi:transcriptional regulator with XRE-family HTH domain